jgi:hypothetical protein
MIQTKILSNNDFININNFNNIFYQSLKKKTFFYLFPLFIYFLLFISLYYKLTIILITMYKKKLLLIIFLSFNVSLTQDHVDTNNKNYTLNDQLVFIFVHGTFGPAIRELFDIKKIHTWYRKIKKIKNNISDKSIHNILSKRWLHKKEQLQILMGTAPGLININDFEKKLSSQTYILLQYIKKKFNEDKETYPISPDYYIYSWNGSMYEKDRKNASSVLYNNLIELQNDYFIKNINPIFCFVSHSHGGSVVLNMSSFLDDRLHKPFEHLFLYGVPLFNDTINYAYKKFDKKNYLFKNIFNIFSYDDHIQQYDITNPSSFFTQRQFPKPRNGLYEMDIAYYTKKIKHTDDVQKILTSQSFYSRLSSIAKKIFTSQRDIIYPNHFNLISCEMREHNKHLIPPILFFFYSFLTYGLYIKNLKNYDMLSHVIYNIENQTIYFLDNKNKKIHYYHNYSELLNEFIKKIIELKK